MLDLPWLAKLYEKHRDSAGVSVKEFPIQGHFFEFNRKPSIMGVVNLSADSWYRESVALSVDAAVNRAKVLHAQGATIVDVGAESSLAHAQRVGVEDQNSSLLPVIAELRSAGIIVSVETYHASVAKAGLQAGAGVVNLTGLTEANEVYRMAGEHQAAVILCYVQGANVREVGDFDFGTDPVAMMYDHFARQIETATKLGVEKIFIDPGLGFYYRNLKDSSVRVRHQMQVFLNSFRLRKLGFPVCHALPHAFEYFGEEVRCAEPFFAVLAALGRTDLFRTHEVARTKAVLDTLRAF